MHYNNIQCLKSLGKLEEFKELIGKLKFNVLCLNEHWLKEDELFLLSNNTFDFVIADFYCRNESI